MATATRTRKSARRQRLEAAVNYPIDWLEERSGLIGGLRYFLFRKVPGDSNWFHTLGSATLTAFLVQAITGVILAMYYKPEPKTAYQSIQHITNDVTLGWLVRGMHKWGASVGINLNGTAPVVGPFLSQFLRGGAEIGADTIARFYSLHMLLLPGGIIGLI